MFCPKCGKMNPDDREFCSGCNAVLHEPENEAPKEKNNALGRIIAIIVAAAVVVGGSTAAVVSCNKEPSVAFAEACYITVME